jgi:hypothetical protein
MLFDEVKGESTEPEKDDETNSPYNYVQKNHWFHSVRTYLFIRLRDMKLRFFRE